MHSLFLTSVLFDVKISLTFSEEIDEGIMEAVHLELEYAGGKVQHAQKQVLTNGVGNGYACQSRAAQPGCLIEGKISLSLCSTVLSTFIEMQ